MACVRSAWLVLSDGRSILLEDESSGYFCTSLDLGYPDVREVTNARPDADGTIDTTLLYGARVVTAAVSAFLGAGASIDDVYGRFAPFVALGARPDLHYVLDRPNAPERVLRGLRAAAYAGPIAGPFQRDLQMQWVAADPFPRGVALNVATAWRGSGVAGRGYNLTFNRTYPAGSSGPVAASIPNRGDVALKPYLRIYGPVSNPVVQINYSPYFGVVGMLYNIDAGHFVGIDTDKHTAFLDDLPNQSVLSALDWVNLRWPVIPPDPRAATLSFTAGDGATSSTQVQATWQDGFLT